MRLPLLVQTCCTVRMWQQYPPQRTWEKLAGAECVLMAVPVLSWSGPSLVLWIGRGHATWWHVYPSVACMVCSSAAVILLLRGGATPWQFHRDACL
jgi:hypothetical protein